MNKLKNIYNERSNSLIFLKLSSHLKDKFYTY